MASAGWHYAPAKESNDFARCAYCELSLDGWEANDNPLEEHQRRSPLCVFFNWKPVKRPVKKSRASVQSVANSVHDDDDSEPAPAKKAPRAKKAKNPEPSLDEPAQPRGRKRPSTAAQGPIIIYDGSKDTDSEIELLPPPAKKRATRASLAAQQARGHNGDHNKVTDNSEAESITSTMSKTAKQPAKKKPGRRASKVRAPSKSRATGARKPKNAPSDDELDRALAADLERPLTDEEEGFKDFKTPFIRQPFRRLTRSRTSIAVEESARDAPAGMLLHTSTAKRGRSRTPAVGETPLRNFNFRESGQDFSMPVRVPKHLIQGREVANSEKSPERRRQEGVAEAIARDFSAEQTDMEVDEPKVKKAPAKKAAKGRKKGSSTTAVVEDEPGRLKTKKGRPPKKTGATRSSSNTFENHAPPLAVEIVGPSREVTAQYEQPSDAAPGSPKCGQKGEIMEGVGRVSVISIASTATPTPDAPEELTEPKTVPEPVLEPHQSSINMDMDPAPADLSDAGSVIRYDITVASPIPEASSDAEPEKPKEPTLQPEEPKQRRKKTSGTPKPKKTTRSSVRSQATTPSMGTDGTASVINSGEESDVSHASHSGPTKGSRKVAKKSSKKTLVAQKNKEDMLKKGSESFFGSSQNEEMANDAKRGRGGKVVANVDTNAKVSFTEKMSIDGGSVVSDTGDACIEVKVERPGAVGRVVSWADVDSPNPPVAEEELSATDVDTENSEQIESPVDVPPSPARRPLSPMRTAVNIPLAITPKSHGKASGRLASSRAWTAVELESVLANLNTSDEQGGEDAHALDTREMDMTVEEWIRFSAAEAELRITGEAERVVAVFEREGKRAMECVEGLITVD